jgi:dienelactone hydrolase
MKIRWHSFLALLIASLVAMSASGEKRDQAAKDNAQAGVLVYLKARIKEGKTQEAIQAGMKTISYFKSAYPSASVRAYIESSGEARTLHVFAEYKDRATYEKTRSKYIEDEKWMALYRGLVLSFLVPETVKITVLTSPDAFVREKPVPDLFKGQEGKIYFSSINLRSFRDILAGGGQSKPVTIFGTLSIPKKAKGKVPAVVMMHGVGGIYDHYFEVAHILNEMGIAAFVLDSWETRGIHSVQGISGKFFHSFAIRISDAYAALELLSTHPKIDKRRIGLMGYSHGAAVALLVTSERIRYSFIADDLRYAAIVAYYPLCLPQIKDLDFTDAPVLMLLAEKDNICPIGPCLDYARRIKQSGVDIKAIVYKEAHHQFPILPAKKTIKVPGLADYSNCGENEYLLLKNDGTWYSPYRKEIYDGVDPPRDFSAGCRKDGEAIMGGNEEAKAKSIADVKRFLKGVFSLH